MRKLSLILLICLLLTAVVAAPALAQDDDCRAIAGNGNVNVRWGPDTEYGILGVIVDGDWRPMVGHNEDGDWYAITFNEDDEEPAWVAAWVVSTRGACEGLPTLPNPAPAEEIAHLMEVPILPTIGENARQIFERGQALGNNPNAFTKIGDCNTDSIYFLVAFDTGDYDLGPYEELQPTIDYFATWFAHESLAGQVGCNAFIMLDPLWANPELCRWGEGPLACEYRRARPSVAVVMFGPNDMLALNEEQFAEAVRGVVELSLEEGVIPVLTTFTWRPDRRWRKALTLNMITVEIAREYDITLINLWRAARPLPDYGLVPDYTHLTESGLPGGSNRIAFNGEETFSGHALRNLLTLQTLDMLRREAMMGAQ